MEKVYHRRYKLKIVRVKHLHIRKVLHVEPNAALCWDLDYKGCENGN